MGLWRNLNSSSAMLLSISISSRVCFLSTFTLKKGCFLLEWLLMMNRLTLRCLKSLREKHKKRQFTMHFWQLSKSKVITLNGNLSRFKLEFAWTRLEKYISYLISPKYYLDTRTSNGIMLAYNLIFILHQLFKRVLLTLLQLHKPHEWIQDAKKSWSMCHNVIKYSHIV